ncbi:hypothetical protein CPB86DRAFT_737053 [Serendipita vermifera]|nr:hypothetical protein CPB86DRAFT_737053 [Serendipita vermifera]
MDLDEEDLGSLPDGAGGLMEGLNLQDLKNVVVPSSAAEIGNPSTSNVTVKTENPTAGPSTSGGKKAEKMVPLKGPDGQPVIGPDGQPIMIPAAMAGQVKGGRLPFIPGVTPGSDPKGKKAGWGKGKGGNAEGGGAGKGSDDKPAGGRRRGGKKTRQVFMMDENARKLRKEERFPWLWEDAGGREIWEGKRVERSRVKMQLLQVCKDGTFRWYPAKKYYMFTKLPTWRVPNAEEANDRFEKDQRRRNPLYFAENVGPHSDFSRAFRQHARLIEMEDRKVNLGGGFGGESSLPAGGRALRLVDRGRPNTAFEKDEDDDMGDDDVKRALQQEKQEREQEIFGMEGDMDEMEYEEEMADDDEKVHADGKEDEEKEIEERLKREWRQANKTDIEVQDRTFMGSKHLLGKEGRRMKKMLRGQDKSGTLYESDSDEKDPYASEEDSDSETDLEEKERREKEKAEKEKAEKAKNEEEERLKELLEEKEKERENAAEKDKKGKGSTGNNKNDNAAPNKNATGPGQKTNGKSGVDQSRGGSPKPGSGGKGSRAGSPVIRSGSVGPSAQLAHSGTSSATSGLPVGAGNALTAMRATSPGSPKPRPPMGSASGTSRMTSPAPSGTATPVAGAVKRKAETQPSNGQHPKKQKTASPTPTAPTTPTVSTPASTSQPPTKKKKIELFPGCLTQEMVLNYLKEREAKGLKTQTKDAIEKFKPMWAGTTEGVDIRNKDLLTHWIRKVANLRDGTWLTLR